MGKKSAPSAPPPVDPRAVAAADAEFNRINQITPYGTLTYSDAPGAEPGTLNQATLQLDPMIQANLDQQMANDLLMSQAGAERLGMMDPNQIDLSQFGPIQSEIDTSFYDPRYLDYGGAGLNVGNALDLSQLPGLPQDVGALRDEVESAFFNRADRLLAPKYQQLETALVDRLANQGLPQQDAAYTQELSNFMDERGRTYQDLSNAAVLYGGQEASRELQNALAARQQGFGEAGQVLDWMGSEAAFNNAVDMQRIGIEQQQLQNRNAARGQGLQEQAGIRQNAFNELAALMGLQQVQAPQLSSFYQPGQVDYLGAANLSANQAMQQYQADMSRYNAGLGGLFGLGSALLYGGAVNPGGIRGLFG